MSLTITQIDTGSVVMGGNPTYHDELLTFSGAATVKAGTILARNATTKKLVPFVKGGTEAVNGIPAAVVTDDTTAAGAGDIPIRALMTGRVYHSRLIIAADGDATNIDANVRDQLRTYGIITTMAHEATTEDNQ